MKAAEVISRTGIFWLLLAQLLVILPHLPYQPFWMIGLWLGCAGWRLRVFRMQAGFPSTWAKLSLMLACGVGIVVSMGTQFSVEMASTLLLAAFMLKVVEMRTMRDALVVVFLGLFTVGTTYLFDEGLLAALYSLLPITALLTALVALQQQRGEGRSRWAPAQVVAKLLLQATPLMLLLFVLFPRMAPLWGLPQVAPGAVSGLADQVAPGDIARLAQSRSVAFRATFSGSQPSQEALYWRAITFERYDGRRWLRGPTAAHSLTPHWQKQGTGLDYSIIMEPTNRPWLFSLDVPVAQEGWPRVGRLMADYHLERRRPVNKTLMYQLQSWPQALREPDGLPAPVQTRSLDLPASGNPQTRTWVAQLQQEAGNDQGRLVSLLLAHFRTQGYRYTLEPPPLGTDSIDDFLFSTRAGFCSHYASAMTFALRVAGIPARIVGGYQGGRYQNEGDYLLVRQLDAHAWVEYWQQGQGWVRVDPTFAVVPERIQLGMEAAAARWQEAASAENNPDNTWGRLTPSWLDQLQSLWEQVDYGWQRWVLGYQAQEQQRFLQRWFGRLDWYQLGVLLVLGAVLIVSGVAAGMFWRRRSLDPVQRQFLRYERWLSRRGLKRRPGEAPQAFAERAAIAVPERAAAIRAFAQLYSLHCYAGKPVSLPRLRQALHQVQRG